MTKNVQAHEELEDFLGRDYARLATNDQVALLESYKKKRCTNTIYVLWFFSLHYLYIRQWLLFFLFFISFGGLTIWWVIDLFRMPTILARRNVEIANELYDTIKTNAPAPESEPQKSSNDTKATKSKKSK